MKQTIIPVGYRISVTTWENDGDNYRTETIEGVDKKHVPFIVAVCRLLKSGCNNQDCYGNMYQPRDSEVEAFHEALEGLIQKYPDRPEGCDDSEGTYECLLYELGFSGSEGFYTRVFERIKIEYVPDKIVLQDVTDQFV